MRCDKLYQPPPPPRPSLWRRGVGVLLALLLTAGALSAGLLLWLQPYVTYSREGARLSLPWQQESEAAPPPAPARPAMAPAALPWLWVPLSRAEGGETFVPQGEGVLGSEEVGERDNSG